MNEEELFDKLKQEIETDLKKPVNPGKLDYIEIVAITIAVGLVVSLASGVWFLGIIVGTITASFALKYYYLGARDAFKKAIQINLYYGSK